MNDPARKSRVLAAWKVSLQELATEFPLVLVYPIPEAGWNVPRMSALEVMRGGEPLQELDTSYDAYIDRAGPVLALFDQVVGPRIRAVRSDRIFCNSVVPDRCVNIFKGQILYFDDDHLANSTGAVWLAGPVVREVQALIGTPGTPVPELPGAGDVAPGR